MCNNLLHCKSPLEIMIRKMIFCIIQIICFCCCCRNLKHLMHQQKIHQGNAKKKQKQKFFLGKTKSFIDFDVKCQKCIDELKKMLVFRPSFQFYLFIDSFWSFHIF